MGCINLKRDMSQWQILFPATRCMKLRWIEFMPHEAGTKWHDFNFECSIVYIILLSQKLPTTIHLYASVRLACTSVRTAPTFVLLCSQTRGLHAGKSPTACLQVSAEVKRLNLHSSFISPLYAPYRFSNLGWQHVSRCQNSEENKRDKNGLYPYVVHVLFFIFMYE